MPLYCMQGVRQGNRAIASRGSPGEQHLAASNTMRFKDDEINKWAEPINKRMGITPESFEPSNNQIVPSMNNNAIVVLIVVLVQC